MGDQVQDLQGVPLRRGALFFRQDHRRKLAHTAVIFLLDPHIFLPNT